VIFFPYFLSFFAGIWHMMPILILDCGSRSIVDLVNAVRAENVPAVIRTMPIQGSLAPEGARYPVLASEDLAAIEPAGIVISGTPHYLYTSSGRIPPEGFFAALVERDIPTLGICGGHELLAQLITKHHTAGKPPRVVGVNPSGKHEPAATTDNPCEFEWYVDQPSALEQGKRLFEGLPARFPAWMWHIHQIRVLPPFCTALGGTQETPHGAISYSPPGSPAPLAFGVQFHPEVSPKGTRHAVFSNFTLLCSGET
jgi:GMP synthase-like glutamine amidotransferase